METEKVVEEQEVEVDGVKEVNGKVRRVRNVDEAKSLTAKGEYGCLESHGRRGSA